MKESDTELTEEQKRRLRAVRRGYRASTVEIKDNGWQIEIVYLDGSRVLVNSKILKLRASELQSSELQNDLRSDSHCDDIPPGEQSDSI